MLTRYVASEGIKADLRSADRTDRSSGRRSWRGMSIAVSASICEYTRGLFEILKSY